MSDLPAENRTLAWEVLEWSAEYLRQPDGPTAGEAWVFTPEQVRIVARWYAIDDGGRFAHRRGVLRRMKGWGKDPFLAALGAVELCGPCRFGGWNSAGLPVAVPHPAPWIQVAAVSQDQTRNTMTLFPGLFSPAAIDEFKIDLGKTIIYARGSARVEAVTSSPRALEGGRPSLVIMNESQEWLEANEGHAMADVIRRNLAKSNDGSARSIEICNAHRPGEGSVAEATYEAWRQAGGHVEGLYYDALEAPALEDLSDRDAVREALLVARGDSTWVDVDRLCAEIADPATREHVTRRYYFNQITQVGESWLPEGAWEAREDSSADIGEGEDVVVGFDGSYSRDSTAIVACTVGPDPHVEFVACWERGPDDPADWIVPATEVLEALRAACALWRVREIAADPYLWRSDLEALRDEGLPVVEFKQSGPAMIAATQRVYEVVMSEQLTHDGDPDLARHVGNCVTKTDARGTRITKDSKHSRRRIDLAVAMAMAVDRAATYKPRRRPRATQEATA